MEVTPPHELLTQLTVLALLALLTLLKLLAQFHAYMPTHMATSSERFKILPTKKLFQNPKANMPPRALLSFQQPPSAFLCPLSPSEPP